MVDTVSLDGSCVEDKNPKPDEEGGAGGAAPASAPDGNGDGISIFDSMAASVVAALSLLAVGSSSGVAAAGCMKLKLDAVRPSGTGAGAVSLLSSLEGGEPVPPPKKEKALETAGAAVSGAAATGADGAGAKKENPEEAAAGAGSGAETGSGVDMYEDMKEKALLAGAAAAASDPVTGSSFFLSGVALTSKPPNMFLDLI
jgi:hypothetical protein